MGASVGGGPGASVLSRTPPCLTGWWAPRGAGLGAAHRERGDLGPTSPPHTAWGRPWQGAPWAAQTGGLEPVPGLGPQCALAGTRNRHGHLVGGPRKGPLQWGAAGAWVLLGRGPWRTKVSNLGGSTLGPQRGSKTRAPPGSTPAPSVLPGSAAPTPGRPPCPSGVAGQRGLPATPGQPQVGETTAAGRPSQGAGRAVRRLRGWGVLGPCGAGSRGTACSPSAAPPFVQPPSILTPWGPQTTFSAALLPPPQPECLPPSWGGQRRAGS